MSFFSLLCCCKGMRGNSVLSTFLEIGVCIFSFHYKLVRAEAKQQNSQILYAFRFALDSKKLL